MLPITINEHPVDLSTFADLPKVARIANKRTHKYALECIRPDGKTTLKDALAAAYIQGMADTISLTHMRI